MKVSLPMMSLAGASALSAALAAPPLPEAPPLSLMTIEAAPTLSVDVDVEAARRFASEDLCPEALALWRPWPAEMSADDHAEAVRCNFQLGRYETVLELTKDRIEIGRSYRALSLAALGAYQEAAVAFASGKPAEQDAEALVLGLETALATRDHLRAEQAIAALDREKTPEREAASAFFQARLARARGDHRSAQRLFKLSADFEVSPWSERARLHQIRCDEVGGENLKATALAWRGGAFEREALLAIGRCDAKRGDLGSSLRAYRLLTVRHRHSDAAMAAARQGGQLLPRLLAAQSPLPPEQAARTFFLNVDLAPPGRDGDLLIKSAARRLADLDLHREAATLLEHQVFNRLRGKERSIVAAELAERYLDAGAAQEAVRVLQSTRIAGLDADAVARRRKLEATALAEVGRTDAAIALLESSGDRRDLQQLGDIHWSAKRWREAASAYASAFDATSDSGDGSAQFAVRAAAAFILAGDREGYRTFAAAATKRLEGEPEADLIASMGEARPGVDFDRRFMKDYRAAFGVKSAT